MDTRNPMALSLAFKRAKAKSLKIKELGINPELAPEEVDELVKLSAEQKASDTSGTWKEHVKGQRWYIEDLLAFSKLDVEERLDTEYMKAFPDTASGDELLDALRDVI